MELSIIIPCYNSGYYLPDALNSIKKYSDNRMYEVVIVNDGSTEKQTLAFIDSLSREDYTIIHQANKGPAAARNAGVRASKGKYLLFLDSDNKVRESYIEKGMKILNSDVRIGVVYGDPSFFGDSTEARFATQDFDMYSLFLTNYIDMCSIVRKKVWEEVGGLDENRSLIGFEDWEFWIRIGGAGWGFYHIKEVLFDYRVLRNSVISQATRPDRLHDIYIYVYSKHLDLFLRHYRALYDQNLYYQKDRQAPFRSLVKFLYYKHIPGKGGK